MKKIIFGIMILVVGLFLFSKCNQAQAYHVDDNGNIASDNLINCPNYSTHLDSWSAKRICYVRIDNNTDYSISMAFEKVGGSGNGGLAIFLSKELPNETLGNWFPEAPDGYNRLKVREDQYTDYTQTFNSEDYNYLSIYNGRTKDDSQGRINNIKVMLNEGTQAMEYEDYATYYKLNPFDVASVEVTWENTDDVPVDLKDYLVIGQDTLYFRNIIDNTEYAPHNIDIEIMFSKNLSTIPLYEMLSVGRIGAWITFYQNDTMIAHVENGDCETNRCIIDLSTTGYDYYNKIVVHATNQDYYPESFGYYSKTYQSGYDEGHVDGYAQGYTDGHQRGYNTGYSEGNTSAELDIYGFLPGIIGAILSFFYTIMQFSVFGISIFDIFVLFFGISMVVLILKIINGGGD